MSWGSEYDRSVRFSTELADTPKDDALESVRQNIADAISALNKKPADVKLALQELHAATGKTARGVMVGRLVGFPKPPAPAPGPAPAPAPGPAPAPAPASGPAAAPGM